MRIYVASSWRNDYQPDVVRALREAGHEVYDFKNPRPGDKGFGWSAIDPNWQNWSVDDYLAALQHPLAEKGFQSDWNAMLWAEACVLVMPCGRSAHIEAGYFVGARKPLLILASKAEPELMLKMADGIYAGLGPLLIRLQQIDDVRRRNVPSEEKVVTDAQMADSEAKWFIGEAAHLWLERYARGRSDADFGAMLGTSGDQIAIRRRTFARFRDLRKLYKNLRFGHFYAALEWEDAQLNLAWADEMQATVAEMRAWRRAQRGEDLTIDPEEGAHV